MKKIFHTDSEFICHIQAPCFLHLSDLEKELIQGSRLQVQFRKGDTLCKQGTFANVVLFVIKGLAKQYVESGPDRSYNIRLVRDGDFLGLSSVFYSSEFFYSAMALTDCQAFVIEKDALASLVASNGEFGLNMMRRYSQKNANLYNLLNTVVFKQMNGKMAETLLYLEGFRKDFPDVFQTLSRQEIADFLGVSVESAIKLLKGFEKDKLISLNKKDIEIVDIQKLQTISKIG
jgi:CRP/FNR family transcriptional regulator